MIFFLLAAWSASAFACFAFCAMIDSFAILAGVVDVSWIRRHDRVHWAD